MGLMRLHRFDEFLRRLLAAGGIVLVFALGVFAASPTLHEQLHNGTQSLDDGCAIVLFASGVSLPLAMITARPAPGGWREQVFVDSTGVLLASPRYLLLPGRGPPVG